MSTSELGTAGNPAVTQGAKSEAAGFDSPIPLAELTSLANAFFRALPGQNISPSGGAPGSAAGAGLPGGSSLPAPGWNGLGVTGPSVAAIAPPPPVPLSVPSLASATGLLPGAPQSGLAVPGVPSLPAGDKIPSETDLVRLAGEVASITGSGVIPPAASTVPGIPGAQALSTSPLNAPGVAPAAVGPAAGVTTPVLLPLDSAESPPLPDSALAAPAVNASAGDETARAGSLASVPYSATDWPGAAISGAGASPFASPLPAECAGIDARLLNPVGLDLDAALPAIPGLPAYADEKQAVTIARSTTSYYFLDQAGALSKPASELPAQNIVREPRLEGSDLKLARNQFDVASVRRDFPILNERVHGKPLVWLDNAATTQKPQSVIDRLRWFYEHENSNIHRAAHELAARATDAYEDARQKVARFLNAPSDKDIVFVRGATEGINLVAKGWAKRHIRKGDEIVLSAIEHHANIVPWQQLAAENGAVLRVIPVDDDGQVLLDEYEKLLGPRTKLVSVSQVSNALGTILPTAAIAAAAHRYGARVLIDGAQSVAHMRADVQALDADFFVFSGHKIYAPTGIGAVYGKSDAWSETPPWQSGGNMIADVTFEKTIYQPPPARFEAGTGSIADAVGLGAAIDYVEAIGLENIARHEHDLLVYAMREMRTIPGLRLIGTAKEKAAVLSFVLDGFKTEEVGSALNREGIAVRSGHHCAQPSLRRFGLESTVRPSLALYNNFEDIDRMIAALRHLKSAGA